MRKDVLIDSSKHKLREIPLLTLQVVDIFETLSYTAIVEHRYENIELESHANNQIFHQILVFFIRCLCSSSFSTSSIQPSFSNRLWKYWIMAHFVTKHLILAGQASIEANASKSL